MLALSEIIDFLLTLMQDENARAEFEQDPQGTLARAGLEGVTGQDVSDARLLLADSGAAQSSGEGGGYSGNSSYADSADPIRQINYTTQHFHATDSAPSGSGGEPELNLGQQSSAISIDDRDSFFFQNFTSDDDTTIVDASTTDNSVTNNDVDVLSIEGSFNEDNDNVAIDAQNSFNTDDDVLAIQANDNSVEQTDVRILNADGSFNDVEGAPAAPAAEPPAGIPVEPPGAETGAPEPLAADPPVQEPPVDEPAPEDPPLDEAPIEEPLEDPVDEVDEVDDPADDAGDAVAG